MKPHALKALASSACAHLNPHLVGQPVQVKKAKGEPKALAEMKRQLTVLKVPFVCEYRFHEARKFRFDIALVDQKVAIEYEGIMSAKSRHTSVTGYSGDADKYNLAQSLGWKVFRYTVINYKNFLNDLKEYV